MRKHRLFGEWTWRAVRRRHGTGMMNKMCISTVTLRHGVWSLLVAIVAVVSISTPSATAQESPNRRLEDVFTVEQSARVREIARQAQEVGVPAGLVTRQAFEGAAKGYPPDRIVSALEGYAGRLGRASSLLGPGARPASIAAGAEALRRGVSPDVIRILAGRRSGSPDLAVPHIVLSDLTDAGVPPRRALEMVNHAIDRGARGDQMLALSAAVRRQMRQGADWQTAVDAVRRRIERQRARRDRPPVPPGSQPPNRIRDGG